MGSFDQPHPEPITILASGEQWFAVYKPASLSTQAPGEVDSLETRLRAEIAPPSGYLAFPHRLDRPVSGVILVATAKRAAKLLGAQFEARKVEKTYLALVSGYPHGLSAANLGQRVSWRDWLLKRADEAKVDVAEEPASDADRDGAKLAETEVEILSDHPHRHCALLKLMPRTGRMHQLRVQAAHRGSPILGDTMYGWCDNQHAGPAGDGGVSGVPFHPLRIALHAASISFHEPQRGRRITVAAPLDADWNEYIG